MLSTSDIVLDDKTSKWIISKVDGRWENLESKEFKIIITKKINIVTLAKLKERMSDVTNWWSKFISNDHFQYLGSSIIKAAHWGRCDA